MQSIISSVRTALSEIYYNKEGFVLLLFKRLDKENEEQFLWRIGQAKDSGAIDLDWSDIADIMNREFREDESEYRNESAYRKPYQQAKRFFEANVFNRYCDDSYLDELREAKHEIRKEKQKLFDERVAINKILREQGRMESMYDIVKRAIDEYIPTYFEFIPHEHNDSENDLVIHLTDIHYGVNIISPFNIFDSDILKKRLANYLNEITDIRDTYQAENAYLIIGGDLIHGLIHLNARIEAKENVVQQIMHVSDLISNFIYELSRMFKSVYVHTTAGNHARVTPNKEETTRGENFDLLIPFACKKELQNIENVFFFDNVLGYDIATFTVRGHMIYATHGDKDSTQNVVYHMTQFARKAGLPLPDICYLGHRHTNGLTTVDDVKIIESGCVDGMDSFAIEKRLVGSPEQTVTVISKNKRIKALCDVQIG